MCDQQMCEILKKQKMRVGEKHWIIASVCAAGLLRRVPLSALLKGTSVEEHLFHKELKWLPAHLSGLHSSGLFTAALCSFIRLLSGSLRPPAKQKIKYWLSTSIQRTMAAMFKFIHGA